jgi:hypothetical protein
MSQSLNQNDKKKLKASLKCYRKAIINNKKYWVADFERVVIKWVSIFHLPNFIILTCRITQIEISESQNAPKNDTGFFTKLNSETLNSTI